MMKRKRKALSSSTALMRPEAQAPAEIGKLQKAEIVYPESRTINVHAPPEFKGRTVIRAPSTLTPIVEFSDVGDYITGTYLGTRTEIGPNKSKLHDLRLADGAVVSIWGCTILDAKMLMGNPPLGAELAIVYLGDLTTSRGLNPAKNFELMWEQQPEVT